MRNCEARGGVAASAVNGTAYTGGVIGYLLSYYNPTVTGNTHTTGQPSGIGWDERSGGPSNNI
ncbi:MAG: hypothetical protein LBT65_00850 [Synergistaceae bacterium]|nr:hypothetical protein [Synergistaceae bacterium]